jgi:hypothetical protein
MIVSNDRVNSSFLHLHWQTQKALYPMIYYLFGILFLIIGEFNKSKEHFNFDSI